MRAITLLLLALLALAGCGKEPACSSTVSKVSRDPGSDLAAMTELRGCGATTDYATIVRVGRIGEPPDDMAEVFIADTDHGAATEGDRGAVWTSVVWTAPRRLSVAYASRARVFRHIGEVGDTTIVYRADEPSLTLPAVP